MIAEEDESEEELEEGVQLGFVEEAFLSERMLFECGNWCDWDGGIAGGQPSWLGGQPSARALQCEACGRACVFLLEIYAPLDEPEAAFHRALYVFWCARCEVRAKVLRRQLPRRNDYYDFESPTTDDLRPLKSSTVTPTVSPTRFEVVVEAEPPETIIDDVVQAVAPPEDSTQDASVTQEALNDAAGAAPPPDETTLRFLARVAREPAQVLRYKRRGRPLYVSRRLRTTRVAPCERCGAPRSFEFQIMPQFLYFLNVEKNLRDLNFGTILVFTCDNSCDSPDFATELAIIQPPLDDHPQLEPLAFRRF